MFLVKDPHGRAGVGGQRGFAARSEQLFASHDRRNLFRLEDPFQEMGVRGVARNIDPLHNYLSISSASAINARTLGETNRCAG
jgi:hypothetical protein